MGRLGGRALRRDPRILPLEVLGADKSETEEAPIVAQPLSVEVTGAGRLWQADCGTLTNTCFRAEFTDLLLMMKDRSDALGR